MQSLNSYLESNPIACRFKLLFFCLGLCVWAIFCPKNVIELIEAAQEGTLIKTTVKVMKGYNNATKE